MSGGNSALAWLGTTANTGRVGALYELEGYRTNGYRKTASSATIVNK